MVKKEQGWYEEVKGEGHRNLEEARKKRLCGHLSSKSFKPMAVLREISWRR